MSQNPKSDEDEGWSTADIAAMISWRDTAREASATGHHQGGVEFAPGFQHDEGEYVVDPDYADILSIDYEDLVRRKVDINRR